MKAESNKKITKKSSTKETRVREVPKHRSFKLSKKKYKQPQKLSSTWTIVKSTLKLIKSNKRLFIGIIFIYSLLSFILVQGAGASFQITEIKNNIQDYLGEKQDNLGITIALFGYLVGSTGSSVSEVSGVYQMFMILITSLAVIWGIRQIQAGEKPGVRDVFYKGIYPLVPFIGVILVIGLQLIPLLVGNLIYNTVVQNGLVNTALEGLVWFILFILLAILSIYMLVSSIFALYIVTLPDMRPIKALKSARELVLHRRFRVVFRIFGLLLVMMIISIIIFLPLLFIAPQLAEILFLFATSFALVFFHMYMYLLYRELI